ncbi:AMP-dependent synthetase/ligase [Candidatus Nitrosacidococcus tergens]|uniref:AMP-dependent synthetase and ligase n=1 Tax=Candidatus Nitrosacidococcus tergens TaxID=553981 RepID=A0A7G1Q9S8_9GAMM|nr:long-chain fatty acid--CoA ligase [Candidatus Nitrosacidococcus tergens]CAB1276025.1 AMP-dependent synthetase and ligase [Candidatus Nitrosacidococcus tergens]
MNTNYLITPEKAKTLAGLFQERVRLTPNKIAYQYFNTEKKIWVQLSWADMDTELKRWQAALTKEDLKKGDRVAIMLPNCPEWVLADQAALSLGFVVVPLYVSDRAENIRYILKDSNVKLLIIKNSRQWQEVKQESSLDELNKVVSLTQAENSESKLYTMDQWLPLYGEEIALSPCEPSDLATIVYTSGTTGNPKGVMLSHQNILWNACSSLQRVPVYPEDSLLSFLPLSHMFERTLGYYLPMMVGASVSYARASTKVAEDLVTLKPTTMISVPRVYERIYDKIHQTLEKKPKWVKYLFRLGIASGWQQFRVRQKQIPWHLLCLFCPLLKKQVSQPILEKFGGNLRVAICGGAALSYKISKEFLALNVPLIQGYGLTEASPTICANAADNNDPRSIGTPLQDVEIKVEGTGELLIRSPGVMLGYWNNPQATAEVIDQDYWLHTGDQVRIDQNRIYITGRIKEIIVLTNGEKVPPAEMEAMIGMDPLFEQIMVVGEHKPYLGALIVLNSDSWVDLAKNLDLNPNQECSLKHPKVIKQVLGKVKSHTRSFPGYAKIRNVFLSLTPWTVENGLLTPTLKIRRNKILSQYQRQIEDLYS